MVTVSNFYEPFQHSFGGQVVSRLKQARLYLGFSTVEVAQKLDLNESFLVGIENGTRKVAESTMMKLSELYDRPYDWLNENRQFDNNSGAVSYTPLPDVLSTSDRREIRAFMQVMDSKSKKANITDKLEKLIMCVGANDQTETLHHQLDTYEMSLETGQVDLLNAIVKIGLTVIFRPLESVDGTLIRHENATGLLLSILRSIAEIRLTSATVLSALLVNAKNENLPVAEKHWYPLMSNRELKSRNDKVYELAINLLLPNFLIADLQNKQKWNNRDLNDPINIYQLALRLGASYEDTVNALRNLKILSDSDRKKMLKTNLIDIKRTLLEGNEVDNLVQIDVWCLSHQDEGTIVRARPNDLFVFKLTQNCSAGYLWQFDTLKEAGFAMLRDWTKASDSREVGLSSLRKLIAKPNQTVSGYYEIEESCPWERIPQYSNTMAFSYEQLKHLKEGLFRSD